MTAKIIGKCELPDTPLEIPLFVESVPAGFPSPAQDYVERTLDLNELCIRNAPATFFVRAEGDSMINAGIRPGDILIVDRSLEPRHKDIVIAKIHGELTVKLLHTTPTISLVPMNPNYQPIQVREEHEMEIFGVVTFILHPTRRSEHHEHT
ncbi:Peptidase S24/S26A/S26B, conserved region [Desulfurispirillum indicum S5]|uniref:Peptidase S24/S26A/S26B, conserved region n=1 Tax=Desulfurispirillum indicum (strain ATCC BAA-1389 / DSM 22839 / S5) TaxID=653733 RepID=E6W6Y2_DESIS|nr:translesion error-prone DNA polymerase V autoproteolytic subunit [Desulfurispirillum indicum]ADU66225.1 Peptidase S24/S26A/S26B, conserved region [Desulfurispirillum indicum S5]